MADSNAPEILTVTFETMAQGGEALARQENGRVVFVPYAIAGETARVEITDSRRGFARGRIIELLQASPSRIEPLCPHFPPTTQVSVKGYCGGCQWQHISYPAQLAFKTQIVRGQFARVAKMPNAPVFDILPSRREWYYRNNMQFVVNEDGKLCLREPESHDLVPIIKCYILGEPLQAVFQNLELDPESFDGVMLRMGETTGENFVILESEDPETPEIETDEPISIAFRSQDVTVPILGKEFLNEKIGDREFQISPDSFFQVNTPMAQVLLDLVTAYLEPRADDILLDGYSGVGLFGLSLANQVARVIEIESSLTSIEDAEYNARDLENVELYEGQMEVILPRLDANITLAVVDPPRAGLERPALDALAKRRPRTIAYVSCDTATLARDVARLVEHGYRLDRVQPVDLFPQTHHIECVARLVIDKESGVKSRA